MVGLQVGESGGVMAVMVMANCRSWLAELQGAASVGSMHPVQSRTNHDVICVRFQPRLQSFRKHKSLACTCLPAPSVVVGDGVGEGEERVYDFLPEGCEGWERRSRAGPSRGQDACCSDPRVIHSDSAQVDIVRTRGRCAVW
eukprot:3934946-Rhodomonas_salina.7